ncbi:zinc finger protein with KRAB and SCAN domains 8-like [Asterias rubens]|uniref:zinc finger protein with KRAB and SCAN domains 8-like n=1 Tax=Asterias rubens TaxID=7604 RepID=UPI001455B0E1|nr:zinc finger protein with KRAB and SCAN domains 8-like [Asterias rubens]
MTRTWFIMMDCTKESIAAIEWSQEVPIQSSSSVLITLHKECKRWEHLRAKALCSSMFEEYKKHTDGDWGSSCVDELFISFLLDRLEEDLDEEEKLHPCKPQSEVDRSQSQYLPEEQVQRPVRQKSSRVLNQQKETSLGDKSKELSNDDDLIKPVRRSKRSTQKKIVEKGTAVKLRTGPTSTQKTSKSEKTEDLNQKLAIKIEMDTVNESASPLTQEEEFLKTAGCRDNSSSVCDPQDSSQSKMAEKKSIKPRTSKQRSKDVMKKQMSKISKGIEEDKSKEGAVETKRKRGRPGKNMDAAEREALIFNKRLKEIQHQDLLKMFTCRTCGEQFHESENLRMHTITAHLPISIPDTSNTNTIKEDGEETQFTHIEIDLTLYQQVSEVDIQELAVILKCCPQCNEYVEDLKNHLETHMVKNYICEDCGKGFACQKQLRVHIGYHKIDRTGVMPYSCNFCDRTFRTIQALCIHRPLHSKARNYVCEQCGKAFKSNTRLQKHAAIHAIKKRYSCSFCGRGFAQKCNLNRHLRIHTGEKPYCCHHCSQVFNHNVSLKRHMKKDHFIEMQNNVQLPVKEVDDFPLGRLPIQKLLL